jgi:hypothetical protein
MEFDFWGPGSGSEHGPVATVNPADLRGAWTIYRDAQVRDSNRQAFVAMNVFERVCGPGADTRAVVYRAWMLLLLDKHTMLSPWLHNDELDDVVFRVAAKFPFKKMQAGVVYHGFPLDVQEFLKQIEEEAKK